MPETVLKHRKRVEAWSAEKAAKDKETAQRLEEKKKIIFKRAEDYVKEYRQQVTTAQQTTILDAKGRSEYRKQTCSDWRERPSWQKASMFLLNQNSLL